MNILSLYRIFHGHKISGFRLLGYTFFGYVIGGVAEPLILIINTLVITLQIMMASILNDYYDWRLLGEKNASAEANISFRLFMALAGIPFVLSLLLVGVLWKLGIGTLPIVLLFVTLLLSIGYSIPIVRFKEKNIMGFLAPPVGIFLLFLEGLVLFGNPVMFGWMVAGIVFLFAWFLEFLHLIDDSLEVHEVHKVSEKTGMRALWVTIIVGIGMGGLFSFYSLIFLATLIGWSLRAYALYKTKVNDIPRARRNIIHPLWRLEEFLVYMLFVIV